MSKLPSKVKIAGIDVDIIDWDIHQSNAAGAYGIFSKQENCIKIDTSVNRLRMVETFIHELLHGIYNGYRMEDEDKEERIVATFAAGLSQVFRDSPDVLKFIETNLQQLER